MYRRSCGFFYISFGFKEKSQHHIIFVFFSFSFFLFTTFSQKIAALKKKLIVWNQLNFIHFISKSCKKKRIPACHFIFGGIYKINHIFFYFIICPFHHLSTFTSSFFHLVLYFACFNRELHTTPCPCTHRHH